LLFYLCGNKLQISLFIIITSPPYSSSYAYATGFGVGGDGVNAGTKLLENGISKNTRLIVDIMIHTYFAFVDLCIEQSIL
jgi:hypothetical protein